MPLADPVADALLLALISPEQFSKTFIFALAPLLAPQTNAVAVAPLRCAAAFILRSAGLALVTTENAEQRKEKVEIEVKC